MNYITINDYKHILEFYNKPIPANKQLLKQQSNKILISKLCKCIKKLNNKYKGRSIGICTKTVINRKGFIRGNFQCKKKRFVTLKRKNRAKTRRNS